LIVLIASAVDKTLWNYLELLIVPAALALGVYWLNLRQDERHQQDEDNRSRRESEAQAAQVKHALDVENERAQDEALREYLDQMSRWLTDKDTPLSEAQSDDNLRVVARARTLTVLPRLDSWRKRSVLQFLYEAKLINREHPVVSLEGADLSHAALSKMNLSEVDLSGSMLLGAQLDEATLKNANLSRANLSRAVLVDADLTEATLKKADLWYEANLFKAKLIRADLRGAELIKGVNLKEADLEEADLREAVLDYHYGAARFFAQSGAAFTFPQEDKAWETDLEGTNLRGANLHDAKLADKQLAVCKALEGATMPDGQKYEDWLKSQGRG
jgi:uncharacterized protein YjbI with pentapeptide repeats